MFFLHVAIIILAICFQNVIILNIADDINERSVFDVPHRAKSERFVVAMQWFAWHIKKCHKSHICDFFCVEFARCPKSFYVKKIINDAMQPVPIYVNEKIRDCERDARLTTATSDKSRAGTLFEITTGRDNRQNHKEVRRVLLVNQWQLNNARTMCVSISVMLQTRTRERLYEFI